MKIAVLGAGVIGTTTAYFLAKEGHDVVVVDRQSGAGQETSFANAGEITPGYASPWAAPGIPFKAIKWMFERHAPFKIRMPLDLNAVGWMYQMWSNCRADRFEINTERMIRLAEYSRQTMAVIREEVPIDYDQRMRGTLQLFRATPAGFEPPKAMFRSSKKMRIPYEILDRGGCEAAEPGLANGRTPVSGGLRLPEDETGGCYKFTDALSKHARDLGVSFVFGTNILRLAVRGDRIQNVVTDKGDIDASCFVAALGSYTPGLLAPLDLRVPAYPLKGYSLTVPVADAARAPVSTVLDDRFKVAITRLGDRIRAGGIAEIAGFSSDLVQARTQTLDLSVRTLFPGAGHFENGSYWRGLRPMTPDGTPIVGRTRYPNLFTNTGHGTFGWTMAAGSARFPAGLLSGRPTAVPAPELALERYGR